MLRIAFQSIKDHLKRNVLAMLLSMTAMLCLSTVALYAYAETYRDKTVDRALGGKADRLYNILFNQQYDGGQELHERAETYREFLSRLDEIEGAHFLAAKERLPQTLTEAAPELVTRYRRLHRLDTSESDAMIVKASKDYLSYLGIRLDGGLDWDGIPSEEPLNPDQHLLLLGADYESIKPGTRFARSGEGGTVTVYTVLGHFASGQEILTEDEFLSFEKLSLSTDLDKEIVLLSRGNLNFFLMDADQHTAYERIRRLEERVGMDPDVLYVGTLVEYYNELRQTKVELSPFGKTVRLTGVALAVLFAVLLFARSTDEEKKTVKMQILNGAKKRTLFGAYALRFGILFLFACIFAGMLGSITMAGSFETTSKEIFRALLSGHIVLLALLTGIAIAVLQTVLKLMSLRKVYAPFFTKQKNR